MNKVDKVKNSKLFRKWDILVYFLLVILIVSLLWAFLWSKPKGEIEGVEVLIKDNVVLSYSFKTNSFSKNNDLYEVSNIEDGYKIKVFVDDDKKHFNELIIDTTNKKAYISDANCSSSKDCTTMKAIEKSGESIICVPHQLIVRAIGEKPIKDPISG